MSDLILAVFDDAHTAFLARAALARLQGELSLPGHDLAVVNREEGGEIVLQEAIGLSDERQMRPSYWKTLVSLLFAPSPSTGAGDDTALEKLAAIGIDATFRSRIADQVHAESSAILVLVTGPAMRDQVLGVLRGFRGEVMLTELKGDSREVWRNILTGTAQTEEIK